MGYFKNIHFVLNQIFDLYPICNSDVIFYDVMSFEQLFSSQSQHDPQNDIMSCNIIRELVILVNLEVKVSWENKREILSSQHDIYLSCLIARIGSQKDV